LARVDVARVDGSRVDKKHKDNRYWYKKWDAFFHKHLRIAAIGEAGWRRVVGCGERRVM
jgi:hypothetical protein